MPSKAKMRMKRKRRKRRERMERMELRREMTRLRRLAQYFVTFNTNQVIFARISGHLEDPQKPECAENGEAKLARLWPAHRRKNNFLDFQVLSANSSLVSNESDTN